MAIAFPSSPAVNDTYEYMGRTWIWNGSGWAWYLNYGQVPSLFRTARTVNTLNELPHADLADSAWLNKDYV